MNIAELIISAGNCTSEEEASEAISKMMSPVQDRDIMGNIYTSIMGYDPLTYFDRNEIRQGVEDILSNSTELRDYLNMNLDNAVDTVTDLALNLHKSHSKRNQIIAIKEALWTVCQNDSSASGLREAISEISVPRDPFEMDNSTDDDEDEDDSEFESLEDDDDDNEEEDYD